MCYCILCSALVVLAVVVCSWVISCVHCVNVTVRTVSFVHCVKVTVGTVSCVHCLKVTVSNSKLCALCEGYCVEQ